MTSYSVLIDGTVVVGECRVGKINGRTFTNAAGVTHIIPAALDPVKALSRDKNFQVFREYKEFGDWLADKLSLEIDG